MALKKHGITCEGKRARQMTRDDYYQYDYIIGMETMNIRDIKRIIPEDTEGKVRRLLDFTDAPGNIADPWYTHNFDETYDDVLAGCTGLLERLEKGEMKP